MKMTQIHHRLKLLLMVVLTWSLLGCGTPVTGGASGARDATGEVLQAPLRIPMPLDKAGHKVDVTFDIPEPPQGERSRGYFIGLRVLFAPGIGQAQHIDAHPVSVRLTLHRLNGGVDVPVQLVKIADVSKPYEQPRRFVAIPLKGDLANSKGQFSEHSGASPGTPDASTYVLEFAAPQVDSPGKYRLKLETLKNIPQLHGFKAFLAFEQAPRR
ncbi:hypothetical protein [Hydrogenophaga sp.]|uniref:hypothetical protein n=1 Tax=Hydrogenophaga sp. TaxID=1904254 RepID=UPI002733938C|nr:hypothetical protein [Hydrogenophaga sp.]MDP3884663.1 hypothetical protein [Hydrogenophaga sp.]